jgi:hypothetical protein
VKSGTASLGTLRWTMRRKLTNPVRVGQRFFWSRATRPGSAQRDDRVGVACIERGHLREDQVAGDEAAVERRFVLAADDGEGRQDVIGVVARQAVEVEVERIEPGAALAPVGLVPREGRSRAVMEPNARS